MASIRAGGRASVAAITVTLVGALSASAALATDDPEGPVSLFLSYKCPAQNRAAFRAYMEKSGVHQFESWKDQGIFGNYLVLFSSFAHGDSDLPDMQVKLDFAAFADVGRWREIERTRPAGMSPEALAMCAPQDSHLAHLTAEGVGENRDPAKSVYLRIPLHFKVTTDEYLKYFHAYVKPQYDGWVTEGTFASWGAYQNYLTQGDAWDMIVLYEYRDLPSFANRYSVREKVRARLRQDPAWVAMHESKFDVRSWDRALILEVLIPSEP